MKSNGFDKLFEAMVSINVSITAVFLLQCITILGKIICHFEDSVFVFGV